MFFSLLMMALVLAGQLGYTTTSATLSDAAGKKLGQVVPATPLRVVASKDSRSQVVLQAWQRKDQPGVLYAKPGGARLGEVKLSTPPKPEQERRVGAHQWQQISVAGWVNGPLAAQTTELWKRADKLYVQHCGSCHPHDRPERNTASEWRTIMNWMEPRTTLSPEDAQLVTHYLQHHAQPE